MFPSHDPEMLEQHTKVFVNGAWFGIVYEPEHIIQQFKAERRNGLLPFYNSISWNIKRNEIHISTDAGRMMRPIFYMSNGKISYETDKIVSGIVKKETPWQNMLLGTGAKPDSFNIDECKVYNPTELYDIESHEELVKQLDDHKGFIEYIDTSESESSLIAMTKNDLSRNPRYTHIEIHPLLIVTGKPFVIIQLFH